MFASIAIAQAAVVTAALHTQLEKKKRNEKSLVRIGEE